MLVDLMGVGNLYFVTANTVLCDFACAFSPAAGENRSSSHLVQPFQTWSQSSSTVPHGQQVTVT